MARQIRSRPTQETFRAKVSGRHAITLPVALRERLGIADGDTVELTVRGDEAWLRRVADESEPAEETDEAPPLIGILADYFTDREDVQRFLDEERSGWTEREERLGG